MKLWYGILGLLVLGICIAGCTQPQGNATGTETPTATTMGTPMETPTETVMANETMTVNETPTTTGNMTVNETPTTTGNMTMNETTAATGNMTVNETSSEVPPVIPSYTALNASSYSVSIVQSGFIPATLEVPGGSMVVWTNEANSNQTVTGIGIDSNFDSGLLAPGETFTWTFVTPGTYNYTSQTAPAWTGTIIVGGVNQTQQTNSTGQ